MKSMLQAVYPFSDWSEVSHDGEKASTETVLLDVHF